MNEIEQVQSMQNLPDKIRMPVRKLEVAAAYFDEKGENLIPAYFRCIISALILEHIYASVHELKPIRKHVKLPRITVIPFTEDSAVKMADWFKVVYDRYHPLRNNVETLDSVEDVRMYLKNSSQLHDEHVHLHNLYKYFK